MAQPILDRRVPPDFDHVTKYPGSALRMLQRTVANVEVVLSLPKRYHAIYDQGEEGACVGFGQSIMMSLLNRRLYDAYWLYREAQAIDDWADTPPQEGTSLRAGFDVLRSKGHRQLWGGAAKPPKIEEGIVEVNRWITTVDEMRTALANKKPVNTGINFYTGFFTLEQKKSGARNRTETWMGLDHPWGSIAGGHDLTVVGASDRREAFAALQSWGLDIPWPIWIPYRAYERLLNEDGEAAIVTDR